jgi:hypothetical protein
MSFANEPNFTRQSNVLCSLLRTELKTDDLLTLLFAVNRFAVGLLLQYYGIQGTAAFGYSRNGLVSYQFAAKSPQYSSGKTRKVIYNVLLLLDR